MATSDHDIVQTLSKTPEKGFRLLMAKYKEPIYWHIRRLVGTHDNAQDAAQETFVRVFRAIAQLDTSSSLSAWIYRIATHEALRLIEKRKTTPVSLDDDAVSAPCLAADAYVDYHDAEAVRMQRAIRSLPTKQQLVFNLRYYDELDYAEIAHITASAPASAKANYHLAKDKIVKYLREND